MEIDVMKRHELLLIYAALKLVNWPDQDPSVCLSLSQYDGSGILEFCIPKDQSLELPPPPCTAQYSVQWEL